MFANNNNNRSILPLLLISLLTLLTSPTLSAPHSHSHVAARGGELTGRAAFNPFSPSRFQAAGHQGQMDQIRRELGHSRVVGGRTKRMVVRKRKECAVKTSTVPPMPSASDVPTGTVTSVEVEVSTTATSTATVEEGQGTIGVPIPVPSASSLPVQNAPVVPTTTSSSTVVVVVPVPTTTTAAPTTSSSVIPAPAPTSSAPSSGFKSPDYDGNGPFSGSSTYYVLGTDGNSIGACGNKLVDSDLIAAASDSIFDTWPGSNGNSNQNPICGQFAKVSYQGKSVVVRIEDRCPGCARRQLDLSPSAFSQLADFSVGMMDVTWEWVGSASG